MKTILITAGPTKEYIDPVRFISNDSSGRMGYLLAKEAKKLGARVILISGPVNIKTPKGVRVVKVVSAKQMFEQVKKYYSKSDVFISCAAVSDYRVKKFSKNKIKKTGKPINLKLIPNPDILYEISRIRPTPPAERGGHPSSVISHVVIGFALETGNLIKNASKKLTRKKLDMIIANRVDVMNSNRTTGAIITKNYIKEFENIPKKILARKILGSIRTI
ncbi:MAG: hypothetical protein JW983_01770 [Elusimicrobia bacterium]|nr:hypothetical protein [Elusimicrobiota bacterium]